MIPRRIWTQWETGAYLGCLFLMMANERYKPVKKFYMKLSLRKNNNTRVMCWP